MAFEYAYSLDGKSTSVVKDYALDTSANYKTSGTNGVKKGDLVILSSGLVRRAGITSAASGLLGILEGQEFTGLVAQGQPYAATNSSFTASAVDTTKYPNGVGKVRVDKADVYRVPVWTGGTTDLATNANVGSTYAIAVDAAGDQTVDLNNTAGSTQLVKIVDFSKDGKTVFVTLV